jgi:uncharacterized protein (TIGR03435 family)
MKAKWDSIRRASALTVGRIFLIVVSVAALARVMEPAAPSAQATTSQEVRDRNAFFDAVSIKPLDPNTSVGRGGLAPGSGGCGGGPPELSPGRIVFNNNKVFTLIAWAYGLDCGVASKLGLITGVPLWARSDQFVIQATFPSNVSVPVPLIPTVVRSSRYPEVEMMLRNMLADRFKLVMHREKKEISALELVVSKGGPKLPLASSDDNHAKGVTPIGAQALRMSRVSMDAFALMLEDFVGSPIVDRTGLTDEFRINIYFAGIEESPPDSAISPLFTALQEQLGLKLQKTKSGEDVIVVDQLEKPTAN